MRTTSVAKRPGAIAENSSSGPIAAWGVSTPIRITKCALGEPRRRRTRRLDSLGGSWWTDARGVRAVHDAQVQGASSGRAAVRDQSSRAKPRVRPSEVTRSRRRAAGRMRSCSRPDRGRSRGVRRSSKSQPVRARCARRRGARGGRRAHRCPQKARIAVPRAFSPANRKLPGDHDGGQLCRSWTLLGRHPSAASWWARTMPPLCQYFSPLLGRGARAHLRTQRSAIPAPPTLA